MPYKKIDYPWRVIDLFSGAGGMSYGFHVHRDFEVVGAADAEIGKPSTGAGAIDCNSSYYENIGIRPENVDLSSVNPKELRRKFDVVLQGNAPVVLAACPPCTGFSRAISKNHLFDDPRNSLVMKTAEFVEEFEPQIVLMENARELIKGKFSEHYVNFKKRLEELGYAVKGNVHMLSRFGLPQVRERALVIAVKKELPIFDISDLWGGCGIKEKAIHVRTAIAHLPPVRAGDKHEDDSNHVSTKVKQEVSLRRLQAIPKNGGSWIDLIGNPDTEKLLIPSMQRSVLNGTTNHYCDVYGRMWWDKPAPTIKRECCHVGNGRYSHPEQDRLCTVREMAILQGFPSNYTFVANSRKNMYRHIGDAVPPLISYQLAWLCSWILTDRRPHVEEIILPNTHLSIRDLICENEQLKLVL